MEPTNNDQTLQEILRLTRENNQMMHHMRRSAFLWGFVRFIIYAALLSAPIWFYFTYLNTAVQQMLATINKIEGTNSQAQNQFQGFENAIQQFESRFGGSTPTSTTTQ
ncbi:MAG TPA: hypothetical protein VMH91_02795 [Candidatus Paceibacterota bacterium]|nr:hypothetical protein [Candidatus Paceibacterota bacterium]